MPKIQTWDEIYKGDSRLGIWPFSELVSLVMNFARPHGDDFRVLELGCGAGANIPFFRSHGAKFYSVEFSPHIVEILKQRFPEYKDNLAAGDFTQNIPFDEKFDLVVDRCSLPNNTTENIRNCLSMLKNKMKPGGKIIIVDFFSTEHSEFKKCEEVPGEPFMRRNFTHPKLSHIPAQHCADENHLRFLLEGFKIIFMRLNTVTEVFPESGFRPALWSVVAQME